MYGKIIKEVKTKEGSLIITRTPICAGMEYANGKISNYKIREIGYYDTKIYVDKLGATYKEERGKRVFTY